MENFAAVDLDAVQKADANIRAAVNGHATLTNEYNIPADVAAQIAASEIEQKGSSPSSQADFIDKFQHVWGSGAKDKINYKLNPHYDDLKFGEINKTLNPAAGPGE